MRSYTHLCAVLLFTACSKPARVVTHSCTMPAIILYNQQYTNSEWDTIITRVYNRNFQPPVITDTFLPLQNTHSLQINHDPQQPKDYEITLLSVGKTYKLYNINTHINTVGATGDAPPCFHDIDFMLDTVHINKPAVSGGRVTVELSK